MRAIKIPKDLDPVDVEALQKALARCRAGSRAQAWQLDEMFKDRSWQEVAEFAAYSEQITALKLRPWEPPPCIVSWSNPAPGDEEAAGLLRRMLESGVSRWDPDPLAALDAIWGGRRAAARQ
jgi:hypothetical protein